MTGLLRIGGSDAAAVCGVDPYRSPVQVWLEKTGRVEPTQAGEAAEWGNLLEPVVKEKLAEVLDAEIRSAPGFLYLSDLPDWLRGTPDGYVTLDTVEGLVEIKTCGLFVKPQWDDNQIPLAYQVQAQHYMTLTGLPYCVFGCLIGGQEFVVRRLEADPELQAMILDLEARFVDLVRSDTPPDPDGSEATNEVLRRLHPKATTAHAVLAPDDAHLLDDYRKIRQALEATEKEKDRIGQEIKTRIGDAETLLLNGAVVATWKNVPGGPVSYERQPSRRFVVK